MEQIFLFKDMNVFWDEGQERYLSIGQNKNAVYNLVCLNAREYRTKKSGNERMFCFPFYLAPNALNDKQLEFVCWITLNKIHLANYTSVCFEICDFRFWSLIKIIKRFRRDIVVNVLLSSTDYKLADRHPKRLAAVFGLADAVSTYSREIHRALAPIYSIKLLELPRENPTRNPSLVEK